MKMIQIVHDEVNKSKAEREVLKSELEKVQQDGSISSSDKEVRMHYNVFIAI